MNIAEGPWVWNPEYDYIQRIVLQTGKYDPFECAREQKWYDNGYSKSVLLGMPAVDRFEWEMKKDLAFLTNHRLDLEYIAAYTKARPKTVEQLIDIDPTQVKEVADTLIYRILEDEAESDDDLNEWVAKFESYDLISKLNWLINHKIGAVPLWKIYDEYIDSLQP